MTPGFEHSHLHGWSPIETFEFFEETAGGAPLPHLGPIIVDAHEASASLESVTDVVSAQLHWTTDTGAWLDRGWSTAAAELLPDSVRAVIPPAASALILGVTDVRGATVTTEFAPPAQ